LLKINPNKTEIIVISPFQLKTVQEISLNIGTQEINSKHSLRNLGFIFDNKMTLEDQVNNICKACNLKLREIAINRNCLDAKSTKILVEALVLSKLNFACTLYMNLPKKQLKKLQKIQNFAARLVTKSPKFTHVTPLLKNLKWLPVTEFIKYRYLTIVYQCIQKEAPEYLNTLITLYNPNRTLRSAANLLLEVPQINSKFGRRSFSFLAPTLWNSLPNNLKSIDTTTKFKKGLKQYLLKIYFEND